MNSQEVAAVYHDIVDKEYTISYHRHKAAVRHAAMIRRILRHLVTIGDDEKMARLMHPIYHGMYPLIIDADLLRMVAYHDEAEMLIKALFGRYADTKIIRRMIMTTTGQLMEFSDDGYRNNYGTVAMILNDAHVTDALIDKYKYYVMNHISSDVLSSPFYYGREDIVKTFVPSELLWKSFSKYTRRAKDDINRHIKTFLSYVVMYGSSRLIDHYIPVDHYHHPRVAIAMMRMIKDVEFNVRMDAWILCGPLYILSRGGLIVEEHLRYLTKHSSTIDAAFLARPWQMTPSADKRVSLSVRKVDALTLCSCNIVKAALMKMEEDKNGNVGIREVQRAIDTMKKRVMGERMNGVPDILILTVA